jgi:hypothetical protein
MRVDVCHFLGDGAPGESAVPAGNEMQPVAVEQRPQHCGIARELAAHFDSCVTRKTRLCETGLEWDVTAQLGHVVVGPCDGVDAERDHHGSSFSSPTASSSIRS